MSKPSWRKAGEPGEESNLDGLDSFTLMSALRGLIPVMQEIADSQFYEENKQDIEFVAYQMDRFICALHKRIIEKKEIEKPKFHRTRNEAGRSPDERQAFAQARMKPRVAPDPEPDPDPDPEPKPPVNPRLSHLV